MSYCSCAAFTVPSPRFLSSSASGMALSSAERGGARAQPPRDQLAALYKLADKVVLASVLCRSARLAVLSAQAALQAEALFGDNSLVVASLRTSESQSLASRGLRASGAEKEALLRCSWDVLVVSVIPLLLRRLKANTLLPGTIREEELNYEVHALTAVENATDNPVPPPEMLRDWASTMGYNTLIFAMYRSLDALRAYWPTVQKRMVESFVLQGLDVIPRTAGLQAVLIPNEQNIVAIIKDCMTPHNYGSAFCTAVLRMWRSNAVSSVLRARGVLQTGVATSKRSDKEFEARKRADIAEHGLRDCALPSCSKTEKTVKEFSLCAGCRSQVYCCLEHQALDWKAHKKACKEKEAARLAEEEAEEEEAGGGAAAA